MFFIQIPTVNEYRKWLHIQHKLSIKLLSAGIRFGLQIMPAINVDCLFQFQGHGGTAVVISKRQSDIEHWNESTIHPPESSINDINNLQHTFNDANDLVFFQMFDSSPDAK